MLLSEFSSEFIMVLYSIPFLLPVIHSEPFIVLEGSYEEITIGDGIEDR
jgi:hypothetical protein